MKRLFFVTVLLTAIIVGTAHAAPMVTVDQVDGLTSRGLIPDGATLVFHVRLFNDADIQYCLSNGYRVYGEGYDWTAVSGEWNPDYNWNVAYGEPFFFEYGSPFINIFSTGADADTIGFAAVGGENGIGLPSGFDDIAYTITVGPMESRGAGPLVIDSSFWYPANYWLWAPYSSDGDVGWGGPYEYQPSCCSVGGDVNRDGRADVIDLAYLIEWLWVSGPEIPCPEEADVDGNNQVDAMDLAYFVDWLWTQGPPLAGCE